MSLFNLPQTYYHPSGAYVRGKWESTTTGPHSFFGTIQPVNAEDFDPQEIGRADAGFVKVYTRSSLQVSAQGTPNSGDVVEFEGRFYEIVDKMPNQSRLIPHYKYLAAIRPEFELPVVGP